MSLALSSKDTEIQRKQEDSFKTNRLTVLEQQSRVISSAPVLWSRTTFFCRLRPPSAVAGLMFLLERTTMTQILLTAYEVSDIFQELQFHTTTMNVCQVI